MKRFILIRHTTHVALRPHQLAEYYNFPSEFLQSGDKLHIYIIKSVFEMQLKV